MNIATYYTSMSILLYALILCNLIIFSSYYDIKRKYVRTIRPLYFKCNYVRKKEGEYLMPLVYELTCAAPVDVDVVERRLTVSVNGEVVSTDVYSNTTTSLGEKSFAQGDSVVLQLVDVDDVGNVSEPAVVEFVANDTIAPSVPGLSVALVREE